MAHIEVIPATPDQQPILANLLELYAYDFSEFHHLELGSDGRFGYRELPLYWIDPDRYPFLVTIEGQLAGLLLVKRGSEPSGKQAAWDVAEFFVLRGYRRRGVGTKVAHQVWRRLPGWWEVRVMQSNRPAHHFWERAISIFKGEPTLSVVVEKGDECWHVFSFESKP